jgi:hypothetical protein
MLQLSAMETAKNRKILRPARQTRRSARLDSDEEMHRARRKKIADEVRFYLKDQGISRPEFEKRVGRSRSTIDHFFAGQYSDKLLKDIEHVFGRSFGQSSSTAPIEWGAYSQEGTAKFAGSYLTLRYDFKNASRICAHVTTIEWGPVEQAYFFDGRLISRPRIDGYGLIFREERRFDPKYTHRGQVWIPGGQYLYLVSAYGDGHLRAAIMSVPDNGKMTGIQLSKYNPKGAAFTPAAAPIAMIKSERITDEEIGFFEDGPTYERYKQILMAAFEDVVLAYPII